MDVASSSTTPGRERTPPRAAVGDRPRSDQDRPPRLHPNAGGRGARHQPIYLQPACPPLIETVEMPWGTKLVPVDELERLIAERRRPPHENSRSSRPTGRPAALAPDVVRRIRAERAAGKSLGQIARGLNSSGIPTAHGGRQWWPSTVRAVLLRFGPPGAGDRASAAGRHRRRHQSRSSSMSVASQHLFDEEPQVVPI